MAKCVVAAHRVTSRNRKKNHISKHSFARGTDNARRVCDIVMMESCISEMYSCSRMLLKLNQQNIHSHTVNFNCVAVLYGIFSILWANVYEHISFTRALHVSTFSSYFLCFSIRNILCSLFFVHMHQQNETCLCIS